MEEVLSLLHYFYILTEQGIILSGLLFVFIKKTMMVREIPTCFLILRITVEIKNPWARVCIIERLLCNDGRRSVIGKKTSQGSHL